MTSNKKLILLVEIFEFPIVIQKNIRFISNNFLGNEEKQINYFHQNI